MLSPAEVTPSTPWWRTGHLKFPDFTDNMSSSPPPWGFPGSSDGKESIGNAGDQGLIPGSGRSPGEANGNPLQYSWLEDSMERGALQATVYGVTKSQT